MPAGRSNIKNSSLKHMLKNRCGCLVYVVGPSGVGKDSLMNWLAQHGQGSMPLHRARRVITRPPAPDGEAHEAVALPVFERLVQSGELALHWAAHGCRYGIRHSELSGMARGEWVLVNGSRAYLPDALARFPQARVLMVQADDHLLQQRLQRRARDVPQDIQARLARQAPLPDLQPHQLAVVHNNGTLVQAGQQALAALAAWAAEA